MMATMARATARAALNSAWRAESHFDVGHTKMSVFRCEAYPRLTVSRFAPTGGDGYAVIYHVEGVSRAFGLIQSAIDALNLAEQRDGD